MLWEVPETSQRVPERILQQSTLVVRGSLTTHKIATILFCGKVAQFVGTKSDLFVAI
jgi:hypothetical protein